MRATLIALLALLAALTSSAYAAGLIDGHTIRNHTIPATKLTAQAIQYLHGQQGPAGSEGPAGQPGPQGPTGPQGPAGTLGHIQQILQQTQLPNGALGTLTVPCPTGTTLTGGGAVTTGSQWIASTPQGNNWYAAAIGWPTGAPGTLYATAICAN